MKLMEVKINDCLSYKNFEKDINIDLLSKLLLNKETQLNEKLEMATRCVNLCEKFHSYFHYEQSYFHLFLAKNYLL